MVQKGFSFNGARCTGCKACMLACKDYHDLSPDVSFRQVYEYAGGEWKVGENGLYSHNCFAYYVSVACNHCSNPACVRVCPTGAMHKDENGLVSVDEARCIGCGYCEFSCPYNAPKVDRAAGHSVKCDGCSERVAQGLRPICVEACPLRALGFGDAGNMKARPNACLSIPPLPDPKLTTPNLVIVKPKWFDDRAEDIARMGGLANIREIN